MCGYSIIFFFPKLFILEIIIIIISNIYTGLLVQDRNPVINQGPVERKRMK